MRSRRRSHHKPTDADEIVWQFGWAQSAAARREDTCNLVGQFPAFSDALRVDRFVDSALDPPSQSASLCGGRKVNGRSAIRTSSDATSRPSGAKASFSVDRLSSVASSIAQEPS